MSEWIESHAAVPRKTKFRHLMRALGTSEVALVIGYLNALWYHGAECCPSGVLEGYTPEDVAEACYYQGDDPAKFTAALVKEHWLDKCPEGYEIHDWQDYNRQHRERQKAAQRQAAKRARERDSDDTSRDSHGDVTVTSRTTDRQTDRQTGQSRARARASEEQNGSARWVAEWVEACEESGLGTPSKNDRAVFGAKVKEIPNLDEAVMRDTIKRMIERSKGPPLAALVYADVLKLSNDEVDRVQRGVRNVR